MAEWARFMVWVTLGGVFVTGAGVVLVFFTLGYTRDAAKYAKSAADAAWETVSEARSAADATRNAAARVDDNTMRELRAYISVEPGGIERLIDKYDAIGQVLVHNVGKLPASNVFVEVLARMADERLEHFPVSADTKKSERVIHPGAMVPQGSSEYLPGTKIKDSGKYAYVWGIVYYNDGYGTRRYTHFCHRYPTEALNSNQWNSTFGTTKVMIDAKKARYHTCGNDAD